MKAIVVILALVIVGYLSIQLGTVYRNKDILSGRVEYLLDFVDEHSVDEVKTRLVAEAKKLGVALDPAEIHISYTDVDRAVGPQTFVSKLADFKNKQVLIHVRYVDRIAGIKWPQEITHAKIKQLEVRQKARPEYEELLK